MLSKPLTNFLLMGGVVLSPSIVGPEEALQIAVKRREVKGIGEKEGDPHLNAEFQRIVRRDKKAFLSD